ncbi:hypothetical protein L6452_19388 [Arctium lappa]|uniref:Uncharacterized protein n=1 Tax=Arctium lappa TaxID=4217 RepID=A0ACB9B7Q1_ARCLA|nr:hypothetical protein L6452_19388 [Arctium lappa]
MTPAPEEHVYKLFDSYWFQYQILVRNPVSEVSSKGKKCQEDEEIVTLTEGNCRNDVEVKGLLRFWAHSIASGVS